MNRMSDPVVEWRQRMRSHEMVKEAIAWTAGGLLEALAARRRCAMTETSGDAVSTQSVRDVGSRRRLVLPGFGVRGKGCVLLMRTIMWFFRNPHGAVRKRFAFSVLR